MQNRIVGTLIVLAVAVIVLPDLLSDNRQTRDDEFHVTPLRPHLQHDSQHASFPSDFSVNMGEQRSVVAVPIVEDSLNIREVAPTVDLGNNGSNAEATPAAPESRELEGRDAWVIQLGAFRNADTVAALLSELDAAGFSAYSRVMRRGDGELHLLMVGPDLSQTNLETQITPLQELTGLQGRVVPYRPAGE
ncbi:MAG: SPOR domain-containing protein [Idiomarina sp.]|nr:SPOR domain-containing protein [Idiomarina sp.]